MTEGGEEELEELLPEEEELEELLPEEATLSVPKATVRTERRVVEDSFLVKMKKYTKLILSVVAIVSFVSFIFYKFRYDRLYNVMQVLEVFGTPDDPSFQPCPEPAGWASVPAAWQAVSASLLLYSAHCAPSPGADSPCSTVSVIAAADASPKLQCKLWIEGATKAIEGIFTAARRAAEGEEKGLAAFSLSCESKYPGRAPYAVTLYTAGGPEHHLPVWAPPRLATKHLLQVCVLPEPGPADSALALRESLLLHSFLGVHSFQLYTPSLPASVLATISALRSTARVEVSPWAPPRPLSPALTAALVAEDCYQRARGTHQAWILLSKDQVLLPRANASLPEAAKELVQGGGLRAGPNRLQVRRFCAEYPTEKQSKGYNVSLRVFESTFYNKQLSKDDWLELNWLEKPAGEETVDATDILGVNEYGSCDRHDFSDTDKDAQYEIDTLRFSKDFISYYNKHM